jgi:hypothetical protein
VGVSKHSRTSVAVALSSKSLLMKDLFFFEVLMLIPSLLHMHFFHFNDTCYLGSNGSTKFLESTVVFDSLLEGRFSIGSKMLQCLCQVGDWILNP